MTGRGSPLVRVDLHTHTWHSLDSWMPPALLVERAHAAGIDRVAVTDHGEIEGALEAKALDPARVIVGQEIRCDGGTEIVGLFLRRRVPMGLRLEDAVADVRDQGGLIYAPHPFAYATRGRWHAQRTLAVADIVEVCNSRAFLPGWDRAAAKAAAALGMPAAAGSDAHFPWELGRAYSVMPSFVDATGLRAAARHAVPVRVRKAAASIHAASVSLEFARRLLYLVTGERGRRAQHHGAGQLQGEPGR